MLVTHNVENERGGNSEKNHFNKYLRDEINGVVTDISEYRKLKSTSASEGTKKEASQFTQKKTSGSSAFGISQH